MVAILVLVAFSLFLLSSSLCIACEFELQVFDGPDQHTNPRDQGTLIADGECRSLGVGSSATFPGYYRATCNGNEIRFTSSGCDDAACQRCEKDPFKPSALFMTLPLTIHPPPSQANDFARSVDIIISREGVKIYFAAYGACGQCPATVAATTFAPVPRPTNAPTTRSPSLRPTMRPTSTVEAYTVSPTMTPTSTRVRAAAAPFTFPPVNRPTSAETNDSSPQEEQPTNENTLTPLAPTLGVPFTMTTQFTPGSTPPPTASPTTAITTSVVANSVVYGSIIGSVVVLLALGVSLLVCRRRNRPKSSAVARGITVHADDKATESENSHDVIVLLNNDSADEDMSTLGGYTATNKLAMSTRDDQHSVFEDPTASVDIPFDYERNEYKATGRSTVGASTTTDFSNASALQRLGGLLWQADDENSFEQQFQESAIPQRGRCRRHWTSLEVQVPPGMVGMVVDNTDNPNEPPVVRALRPDSVLSHKVKIGDRLLSVNGRDVTNIPATQVAKMIAANKLQQNRTLVFARLVEKDVVG